MSEENLPPEDLRQIVTDLERKRSLLKTINDFALRLLGIATQSELVWYVAREVVGRLGFVDCVIYLVDPSNNRLRQVAAIGVKNPQAEQIVNALEIPIGQGVTGHVAHTRTPLIVDDLEKDSRYIPDVEDARSEICVPLVIDDDVAGVIDCEDPRRGHFNHDHLELLTTVASMTSAKLKSINQSLRVEERTAELRKVNEALQEEVAERRQAEDALQASRELLRSVVDAVPAIISVRDKDGRYVVVNPAQATFYGLTAETMVGKLLEEVVPPDYARLTRQRDRAVLDGGRPIRGFDETGSDRDGNSTSWYTAKVPIKGADGAISAVLTTAIDITERKRAEEALKKSEELFARTFHASPGLFAISNPEDGTIYDVNETWLEVLGYSYEAAMAKTALELGIWVDPSTRASFVERLKQEKSIRGVEAKFRTKAGDELDVLVSAEHVDLGGEPRMLIVSLDITAMKQTEERLRQAQKMEAVGQLTGGVAHDFNNLLAVILGNAELLADKAGGDVRRTEAILRAAARGAELTQRLLAFSRRQPLRPQPIDLAGLVAGMSDLLERTLGETIAITATASPELWSASADSGQVENAVLNLAINARDAMPGGGKLTIECSNVSLDGTCLAQNPEAIPGDYVLLTVSDSGTGMSAKVREHAFEPFFTTKEVGAGSGLGLSMVYGFAKQSGGHVIIYSEEGQGTTVKLYLPRARQAAKATNPQVPDDVLRGRGEVVLVIEDDAEVRDLVVKMLDSLDYQVIDVPETESASATLERGERVDLVLSDVILPGGRSGPEFAQEAGQRYHDLKIIFMSGYPAEAAKSNGLLGSDTILLNKPFERRQLAEALREALDR